MAENLRTFIAIPVIASSNLNGVMSELSTHSGSLRITDRDHLHLTLCFLGETRWNLIPEIGKIIDAVALKFPEHSVSLQGIGAFPRRSSPRVLWAGISPKQIIIELAERLAEALEPLGFQREDRRYKPHLTLARVKGRPPKSLGDFISKHLESNFGELIIDQIVLFQSELTSNGVVYTPLSSHELADPV